MRNLSIKKLSQHINLSHGYALLFGMLGAMLVLFITHFVIEQPKKIATIDINFIVNEFAKNEAKKNLSPEILNQETQSFGRTLERNIKLFAKERNIVLLPKEAVYAGAEDYTQLFRAKTNNVSE